MYHTAIPSFLVDCVYPAHWLNSALTLRTLTFVLSWSFWLLLLGSPVYLTCPLPFPSYVGSKPPQPSCTVMHCGLSLALALSHCPQLDQPDWTLSTCFLAPVLPWNLGSGGLLHLPGPSREDIGVTLLMNSLGKEPKPTDPRSDCLVFSLLFPPSFSCCPCCASSAPVRLG